MANNVHVPVLLEGVMSVINNEFGESSLTVFDGTLGGGGYSRRFLESGFTVFGSDLDKDVVDTLNEGLGDKSFEARHGNYSEIITEFDDNFFDVIVVDLGYSSNQLDSSGRGFSYQKPDETFDLRYDSSRGQAAWEIICGKPVENLGKILFRNAGETFANRIARSLKEQPVKTVGELVNAVEKAIPRKFWNKRNAVLSRVWQAFRIEVNQEFEHLDIFLHESLPKLKEGGLLMVVDFHSLEDKMVTQFMRQKSKPVSEDMYGNKTYHYKFLTKKALLPSEEEVDTNVRARSAKLRALKKLV